MRDHGRRCVRGGITDPENPCGVKIHHDGCADRWEKDGTYRQPVSQQGHTKAELERWDTVMTEEFGEHAAYNQPYRLREKIHL